MPTSDDDRHRTIARIVAFLRDAGFEVATREVPQPTLLPGITVEGGTLVYDPERVRFPGDLLHEAGHLAVLPPAERNRLIDDAGDDGGMEMGAIAWSYAALVHLGLPLDLLFHDAGYKGEAAWLREIFAAGQYIGVPILEWRGMTDYQRCPESAETNVYPAMKRWLCA